METSCCSPARYIVRPGPSMRVSRGGIDLVEGLCPRLPSLTRLRRSGGTGPRGERSLWCVVATGGKRQRSGRGPRNGRTRSRCTRRSRTQSGWVAREHRDPRGDARRAMDGCDVLLHLLHGSEAVLGALGEGAKDERLDLWSDVWVQLAWWLWRFVEVLVDDVERARTGERHDAREHLVGHDPDGVEREETRLIAVG